MREPNFLPEGYGRVEQGALPLSRLLEHMERGDILEGLVTRCDERRALHIDFRGYRGIIPREQAISPEISGAERDIALLSRVGRPVRFVITSVATDGGGKPLLMLSRKRAQEQTLAWLMEHCRPGTVLPGKVTHLERFGAFVDIGCGVVALLPLDRLSVSWVNHPCRRIREGQNILVMVAAIDERAKRFTVSTRELLGTWLENAASFSPGETVTGVIRGIKDYGAFVELAPNLAGLADVRPGLQENDRVSVYIRSIRPETMKIKLHIVENLGRESAPLPLQYRITDGTVLQWRHAPESCPRSRAVWDAGAASAVTSGT